jgi:nitrogen fixation/metabolism regulation signal transduction histidine kinase
MLQEKFQVMAKDEAYEQIDYSSDDELGVLVNEYNKMVVELNKSIRLLAKSEREMAWREMAKQIAHEIKNPLTPMKLSIQLLQKSWKNKDDDFNDRLEKVSDTLVEQINSLSAIATEFSAFATMPKELFEKIDLVSKIENSLNLFQESERLNLNFNKPNKEKIYITGDKEQLLRVFNNLIKNAIQAIPKDKNGTINIEMELTEKDVLVKIKDNGSGVKPELREKLFEPNFTTKTSGMGLGLAMVKRMIENMQGEIWFETIEGNGSVFFVKFPVHSYK